MSDNNLDIDLCIMDGINIIRGLNRERLSLMELIKIQKLSNDEDNMYVNEKRLVRVCCLLDKIKNSMNKLPQEEIQDNYWEDKLSM